MNGIQVLDIVLLGIFKVICRKRSNGKRQSVLGRVVQISITE